MPKLARREAIVVVALLVLWVTGVSVTMVAQRRWLDLAVALGIHLASVALLVGVLRLQERHLERTIARSERRITQRVEAALREQAERTTRDLERQEEVVLRHLDATRARLERQLSTPSRPATDVTERDPDGRTSPAS